MTLEKGFSNMENEKTKAELLKEKLYLKNENAYETLSKEEIDKAYDYCKDYAKYLDAGKTERECVEISVKMLEQNGFVPFEYGKKYVKGDKVYFNNRNKALYIIVMGEKSLEEGISIAAAHIDSPRIDLKQHPLYEDGGMAFFKTHYYGGIKKYQWVTIPLALHGVIVKENGEVINVCIGEDDSDPVFCITDLLPHLGRDQNSKPLGSAFTGENLNILVGSRPYDDDKIGEKIKLNVLALLNEKYDITEADLLSSELCLVPSVKARDIGFDRSMIGSYGHDDRVCAYPILTAAIESAKSTPVYTSVTILADKEETGSDGNTGMQSYAFENMLNELAINAGANPRKMFENSKCLSADVNACFDPNFGEVYETRNTCFINKGIAVTKFTGAGGKSSTNDAHAEYVALVRKILNEAGVLWQAAELGKVDQGGGGTVAKYISELNVDVIDIGVGVLSMHAPYEIVSKTDVYMAYKAFYAFFMRG